MKRLRLRAAHDLDSLEVLGDDSARLSLAMSAGTPFEVLSFLALHDTYWSAAWQAVHAIGEKESRYRWYGAGPETENVALLRRAALDSPHLAVRELAGWWLGTLGWNTK